MKNTFAVSMTLLVVLTLLGSLFAYRKATHREAPAAHATAQTHATEEGATGETPAETASAASTEAVTEASNAESGTEASSGTEMTEMSSTDTSAGAATDAAATTAAAHAATTDHAEAPAGDTEAGKAKFAASCGACHGPNAEGGMGGMAPSMANVKGWSLEQFTAAVRELKAPEKELKAPMMKFDAGAVSDADLANMYAWLHAAN